MGNVRSGLECFLADPPSHVAGKRLGLLCNDASVDRRFRHASELIAERLPGRLKALFTPQHGFHAEKQDNMIESEDTRHPVLDIPVFSLYGKTRQPTPSMLDGIDILLVDLQDAGTRVYTFIYTMSYCMEVARSCGIEIKVLDRPNPVNGVTIEGNCLQSDCTSFVGRYPLPMRHGLTIGELARMFNDAYQIGCDLKVVAMQGWQRRMYFNQTGLPWVAPSPNLPTVISAMVYPGQVIWEATNISEGRGTTRPFELLGAPFIDPYRLAGKVAPWLLNGVVLRPTMYEPTANKWKETPCGGFQLHITDPDAYRPYTTSLGLLQLIRNHFPDRFEWKPPPYEYEYTRRPIDLIIGDKAVRRRIEDNEPMADIEASWQADLEAFRTLSRKYHLYPSD